MVGFGIKLTLRPRQDEDRLWTVNLRAPLPIPLATGQSVPVMDAYIRKLLQADRRGKLEKLRIPRRSEQCHSSSWEIDRLTLGRYLFTRVKTKRFEWIRAMLTG